MGRSSAEQLSHQSISKTQGRASGAAQLPPSHVITPFHLGKVDLDVSTLTRTGHLLMHT